MAQLKDTLVSGNLRVTGTILSNILQVDGTASANSFTENGTALSSKYLGLSATAAAALKLTSNAGSSTQPVYFSGGVPVACTYSLNKTVPSNAVFTDHYDWSDITNKPSTFAPTIGTTSTTAAAGNHAHALLLASDSGSSSLTLAFGTKYKLTAGDSSYIFTMPSNPNSNT